MKRIIHMSDLHVGYRDADGTFGARWPAVVQHLIARHGNQAGECVTVITGDLVDDANDASNYGEAKRGLDELRQAGFVHLLVVPGNHDYGTGDLGDPRFVRRFKQTFFGGEVAYPKLDLVDEVAFLGLDSTAEELHWYDRLFAQGEVGARQMADLAARLRQPDVRAARRRVVYLHHHPFDWRPLHGLKDAAKLRRVLQAARRDGIVIDALLYGHNHFGAARHGAWGLARCYDAGSVTMKPRAPWIRWLPFYGVHAATRVIDLDQPPSTDTIVNLL